MSKLILLFTLLMMSLSLQAATAITYQGQLQDGNGLFTGSATMAFRLCDSLGGDTQVGPTITLSDVPVADGLFQVELDFGAVYDQPRWLEIEIDQVPLEPRQPITAAPLAVHALNSSNGSGGEGNSWLLGGNAGTDPEVDFLGTTDDAPVVIRAGGQRVLYLQPTQITDDDWDAAGIFLAGHPGNAVVGDIAGAVISGGGMILDGDDSYLNTASGHFGVIGGGAGNTVSADAAVVLGGYNNSAAGVSSSIGGGNINTSSGSISTVAGGGANTASGTASVVTGGILNCAGARYSWAGGRRAKVRPDSSAGDQGEGCAGFDPVPGGGDAGTFVWADSTNADFVSTGPDQFLIRAGGGVGIGRNDPEFQLDVTGVIRGDEIRSEGPGYFGGTIIVGSLGGTVGDEEVCRVSTTGQLAPCSSSSLRSKKALAERDAEIAALQRELADLRQMAHEAAELEQRLAILEALILEDRQFSERQ